MNVVELKVNKSEKDKLMIFINLNFGYKLNKQIIEINKDSFILNIICESKEKEKQLLKHINKEVLNDSDGFFKKFFKKIFSK